MYFYQCKETKDVIITLKPMADLSCCGQAVRELRAGTTDAALEKHVPAVERKGNALHVQVGEVEHPMVEEHYIGFICTVQGDRVQMVQLAPGQKPVADFVVEDGPVAVYEYCNLHGLWKAEA